MGEHSDRRDHRSAWALVGLIAAPLLCCGLPVLAAAGTLAVLGGRLAANGLWLGGGVILAVAAAAVGLRWWTTRPRCEMQRVDGDHR